MEFLLGFIFSFATIMFVKRYILNNKLNNQTKTSKIVYRQSHIFSLIAPALPYMPLNIEIRPTQSFLNDQKNKQRMVFTEDRAYWIKDNAFYEAEIVDGEIDKNTTKVVDTMTMNKVELDKMAFIVQKLTEGNRNDFGDPGV
jgi:hypothetical protein